MVELPPIPVPGPTTPLSPNEDWPPVLGRLEKSQERVDAASDEAFKLALDAMFDTHLQTALVRRSLRKE